MKKLPLAVGTRYDIAYLGPNLTLASLEGALAVGPRSGPKGDEYEFRRENGRLVVLHPALIVRAELADGERRSR